MKMLERLIVWSIVSIFALSTSLADNLYWSGTDTWDTTTQNWGTTSGGSYDDAIWSNGTPDSAIFEDTAGTVTLGEAITAGGLNFTTDGYTITGNTLTLAGTPALTAGSGISATIGSTLAGSANVLVDGAGTITLTGANTYTGQTMVRNGDYDIGSGASLIGTSRINALDDGELIVSGTATVGDNGQFGIGTGEGSAGTVTVASGGTLNIGNGSGGNVGFTGIGGSFGSGGTAGHGTLNIDGGTVNVAAPGTGGSGLDGNRFWLNPYTADGSATINLANDGVLSIARGITNGGSGIRPATFYFDGGTLRAAASIALLATGSNTTDTRIKSGGAFVDTAGFNGTIDVAMSDDTGATGSLTKQGDGTLTLTRANTYTGATTVEAGTLVFGSGGTVSASSAINVADGATLRFGRHDTWGNHTTTSTSPITVAAGGKLESGGWFNTLVDLSLNGGEVYASDGYSVIAPALALKGTITVGGSQASEFIAVGGGNNMINIGDSEVGGEPLTFDVADVTGSADADLLVGTVLKNPIDASFGNLPGQLIKTGEGTMQISSASTYTGGSIVNAGTLDVTGSLASAVTVNSGATLTGTGTLSAGATVNSGATLSPGASPGTMTLGGDLTLDGANLAIDIWSDAGDGTGHDLITFAAGDLTLNNAPTITVNLNNFDPDLDNSYTIIDGYEWLTGEWGEVDVVNAPAEWTSANKSFRIDEGSVMLTVIPEPNTLGLLLLIGGAAILKKMRMR